MSKPWDQPMLHAADVEQNIANSRAELDGATAKGAEIEAVLCGDPASLRQWLGTQYPGRTYSGDNAAKKCRELLEKQDHEIAVLKLVIERFTVDLETAKVRDERAGNQAANVEDLLATAGKALETRGEELAAELRELIAAGIKALDAMDAANAALPAWKQLTPPLALARLRPVPERVISKQETELWLDEDGEVVAEARLHVQPAYGITLQVLRQKRWAPTRDLHKRARLTAVTEVTFVPAHRFDLLNPVTPTQQVRHEKIGEWGASPTQQENDYELATAGAEGSGSPPAPSALREKEFSDSGAPSRCR
ncbi:hypothetical protein [Mesorhizobium sp.]|uniref:hypothetical protein n=1 Tax=Mesorhizobium sp. TaxID=1871066 RepID=UPI000FE7462B|nr:hypothetical protein [Mesorhizobium sp.]RWP37071.1 MAG: hypothetical protein EOR03_06960 [Mesorhizobium sp.]